MNNKSNQPQIDLHMVSKQSFPTYALSIPELAKQCISHKDVSWFNSFPPAINFAFKTSHSHLVENMIKLCLTMFSNSRYAKKKKKRSQHTNINRVRNSNSKLNQKKQKSRKLASAATFLASSRSALFPASAITIFGLPYGRKEKTTKSLRDIYKNKFN